MAVEANLRSWTLRLICWMLLTAQLVGCGTRQPMEVRKIALLAPFEGPYRELGYNALYAIRLAMSEPRLENVQLLPIDDGGDMSAAAARLRALNLDSAVVAIIALGEAATHPAAQQANDKAMILIGNWGHTRADDNSLYATDKARAESGSSGSNEDLLIARRLISGGASPQDSFTSNGALADAQFAARYAASQRDIPAPNWLASLVYDVTRLVLLAIAVDSELTKTVVHGLNGKLSFVDGYWHDAPIRRYRFQQGQLAPLTG